MTLNYENHQEVLSFLTTAQDDEIDSRQQVRDAQLFLDKKDGQWEPYFLERFVGRPRYTFDKISPIIDDISGEMLQADFMMKTLPANGNASKKVAITYDGLIRSIMNLSGGKEIFNAAAKDMLIGGLAGWEIKQEWYDGDSFDQDLLIKPLYNFVDRVWFDTDAQLPDASDAKHVWVLDDISVEEYETRFPKGTKASVSSNRPFEAFTIKPDFIKIGRILYKKSIQKELVKMSDGSIYEKNDEFLAVEDELKAQGITIEAERKRETFEVKSRIFDGDDWLTDIEDTVFTDYLPIIPTYGNFKIRESKVIYYGAVLKQMDAQRTYNYLRSKQIEEISTSTRGIIFVSRKQAENESDRNKLRRMNVIPDRVFLYTPDPMVSNPPSPTPSTSLTEGLLQSTRDSLEDIRSGASRGLVSQGDTDGPLSGVAIQKLQNKTDTISVKYFESQRIAMMHTCRILIKAIPVVYDPGRQVRVLNEDGSFEITIIGEQIFDQNTNKIIVLNDLSAGKYDVTCEIGAAFKNRQQETVRALNDLSRTIPGLAELTADIQLRNIPAPGIDRAADRVRQQLLESGRIPVEQMTEEEQQQIQEAQLAQAEAPPELTPADKIAEAELLQTQANIADINSKTEERAAKLQLEERKLLLEEQQQLFKARGDEQKIELEEMKLLFKQQEKSTQDQQLLIEASLKGQQSIVNNLNTQAQTLKTLKDAMGIDTIVGPHNTEAYIQQAQIITEDQEKLP